MPFSDQRPGPPGAESAMLPTTVNASVIRQFLGDGLGYLGRIQLAAYLELPQQEAPHASESERDMDANWPVRVVRCTSEGHVYAGSVLIPGEQVETAAILPRDLVVKDTLAATADAAQTLSSTSSTSSSRSRASVAGRVVFGDKRHSGSDSDSNAVLNATAADCAGGRSVVSQPSHLVAALPHPAALFQLPRLLGGRRLSDIVGKDDRKRCPALKFPYTAIGQIEVTDAKGSFICTGTLIAPNKVLTAGHCVWDTRRKVFYSRLSFAAGRYRSGKRVVNPAGVVQWKSVTVFDTFKNNPSRWDVAVVTLKRSVGRPASTLGLAAGCARNLRLWTAGYPDDEAGGTCEVASCMQPYLDCTKVLNPHTCDTVSGMSGSPLWDARFKIRMIHVASVQSRPENRGTTLTQFVINTIKRW